MKAQPIPDKQQIWELPPMYEPKSHLDLARGPDDPLRDLLMFEKQQIWGLPHLTEALAALDLALPLCWNGARILVLGGEVGSGKTVCSRLFCEARKESPRYVSIPAPQVLAAANVLDFFADALGISRGFWSRHDRLNELVKMGRIDPTTLVIDNAQYLRKHDALEVLEWIHDQTRHTFVLVGPPSLEHALSRNEGVAGRVLLRHRLRPPTVEELAPFFDGFSPESIAQIHAETGGRMGHILSMRGWITELAKRNRLDHRTLTAKQVKMMGRNLLVKAAA